MKVLEKMTSGAGKKKKTSAAQLKGSGMILYEIEICVGNSAFGGEEISAGSCDCLQLQSASKSCFLFFLENGRRRSKDLEANLRPD